MRRNKVVPVVLAGSGTTRAPRTGSRFQTLGWEPEPGTGTGSQPTCPGCGSADVLPGRTYCRPSCKARHEYQQRRREPVLFVPELTLISELPSDDELRKRGKVEDLVVAYCPTCHRRSDAVPRSKSDYFNAMGAGCDCIEPYEIRPAVPSDSRVKESRIRRMS